jgi:hypothetical protein
LNNIFTNPRIGEPVFLRNLKVYPVHVENNNGLSLATVEETITAGDGYFRELDTPEINKILFINRGNEPVLMLDGEEITGALQNRVIATSTIAKPNSNSRISVVCAEEGRWDEIGGFKTGNYSYPKLRALLTKGRQTRSDVQKKIWQEIQRKMTVTKTRSATSSMHDIFDNLADEITRYVEDFQTLNHGTVGLIGTAGNRILGCDIFRNSNIYKKIEKKLIKSYALDALEYMHKGNGQPDVEEFLTTTLATLNKSKSRRKTQNITIKGNGLLGQAFVYQDNFVHISVFPE